MSEVFIAYDHADRERASLLAAALGSRGYRTWWEFDFLPQRIEGAALRAVADRTGVTILVWSARATVSDTIVDIASHAAAQSKLVGVRFDDVRLPPAFGAWLPIDLSDWNGAPDSPEVDALWAQIEARALSFLPESESLRRARDKRLTQDLATFQRALKRRGETVWQSYLEREPDGVFAAVANAQLRSEIGDYESPAELAGEVRQDRHWRVQEDSLASKLAGLDLTRVVKPLAYGGAAVAALICVGVAVNFARTLPLSTPPAQASAPQTMARNASVANPSPAPVQSPALDTVGAGVEVARVAIPPETGVRPNVVRAPAHARAAEGDAVAPQRTPPAQAAPPVVLAQVEPPAQIAAPTPSQVREAARAPVLTQAPYDIDALDRTSRDAVQSARRAERSARGAANRFRSEGASIAIAAAAFDYEGELSSGAPQGVGEARWRSGARYGGAWRNGREHGWGVLIFADGARYEGRFENGRPTGNGVLWSADGARLTGREFYAALLRRPA